MALPSFTANVSIDSEGDITKSRWVGTFEIKRIITHQDRFDIEKYCKQYLADDSSATDTLRNRQVALAELRVRVLRGPSWWEATNYGLDMVDITPIYELLAKCAEASEKWHKELEEQIKNRPTVEGPSGT